MDVADDDSDWSLGCRLRPAAASEKPQIHNSIFKIQNYQIGLQLAEDTHEADLRGRELRASAGRSCGPPMPAASNPFEKSPQPNGRACDFRGAALRRGGRLRAAAVPFRNCKFRIQNSGFKIRWAAGYAWAYLPVRAAGCGEHARSGLAERELRASARGKGCDLPIAARLILWNTSPQPSGWACTSGPSGREMQPSAGGGGCGLPRFLLEPQIHNSKFKIQN